MEDGTTRMEDRGAEAKRRVLTEVVAGLRGRATLLACCFGLTIGAESASGFQNEATAWVQENVIQLRTAEPTDEDFRDLDFLVDKIGDRRVVMLGEQSHGAGTAFKMKSRLVRFLHARMGFDVLVWESGFFDMRSANTAMRSGEDPTEAARKGVFTIWGDTEQVRPLFEYIQAQTDSSDPIEMAGFDMQFSGQGASERFEEELLRFLQSSGSATLRQALVSRAERLISLSAAFSALPRAIGERGNQLHREGTPPGEIGSLLAEYRAEIIDSLAPTPDQYEEFLETATQLESLMRASRSSFAPRSAPREISFMLRALENYVLASRRTYEDNTTSLPSEGADRRAISNAQWNRRDARNAANLLWLIHDAYPDRKIVVWAHTGHIFDAYYSADWSSLSTEPQAGGMIPTGSFVRADLGDDVYRIGVVAHHGTDGLITSPRQREIPSAPAGTLEALLHQESVEYGFIELGGLEKLTVDLGMRIRGYTVDVMQDWPDVLDAVLFIDDMRPAERRERAMNQE